MSGKRAQLQRVKVEGSLARRATLSEEGETFATLIMSGMIDTPDISASLAVVVVSKLYDKITAEDPGEQPRFWRRAFHWASQPQMPPQIAEAFNALTGRHLIEIGAEDLLDELWNSPTFADFRRKLGH